MSEKKKEIVFIINSLSGGGAERVISILSNYLVKNNYDVTLLMTRGGECVYEIDGAVKKVIRTDYKPKDVLDQIKYTRSFYKSHPDALFVSFLRRQNLYSLIATLGTKTKIVFSERNNCDKSTFTDFISRLEFDALSFLGSTKHCRKIIFQTRGAADCYPAGARKKGVVIANPLKENIPEPFTGERKKNIVAVGRLTGQKNYRLLVDAFSIFYKNHTDYTLQIYGEGALKKAIQNHIDELNLNGKVQLCGFCENVHERIIDAGMYVMSSDYEGLSNAMLEAMALGLPTISTDHPPGGAKAYIKSYENGILTPVGDAEKMAEAMCFMADNPEKAAEMGKNAAKIRTVLSTEEICRQWKNVFDELYK